MKKLVWSRILFGVGIAILICYVGLLVYFYNFYEYSPYASGGADVDALILSVICLPPTIACLVSSVALRIMHNKSKNKRVENQRKISSKEK